MLSLRTRDRTRAAGLYTAEQVRKAMEDKSIWAVSGLGRKSVEELAKFFQMEVPEYPINKTGIVFDIKKERLEKLERMR